MSDAPETIWASHRKGKTRTILQGHANEPIAGWTKYRRADLPPTPSQIMADERVREMVEAATKMQSAADLREAYHRIPNEKTRIGSKKSAKSKARDAWLKAFNRAALATAKALAQLKEAKP